MRSEANFLVQLAAVAICVAARLSSPGWLLIIFFIFLPIGTVALIVQVVTAACVLRRGRIAATPAALSMLTAACLVGASLLVSDGGDADSSFHRPLDLLLGTHLGEWVDGFGMLLALGWLAGVLATAIAMLATRPTPPHVHAALDRYGMPLAR